MLTDSLPMQAWSRYPCRSISRTLYIKPTPLAIGAPRISSPGLMSLVPGRSMHPPVTQVNVIERGIC